MLNRLLILLLITISNGSYGLSFTNFTINDGLPDNRIWAIEQDSNGYIWLGTGDGLSRFDGYQFKNYFAESNKSFNDDYIKHLYSDASNNLWIAPLKGHLQYLRDGKFHDAIPKIFNIKSIIGTHDNIFLLTDLGLFKKKTNNNSFQKLTTDKPYNYQEAQKLTFTNDKNLLIVFKDKIVKVDNEGKTLLLVQPVLSESEQLNTANLSNSVLYIGSNKNLYSFNLQTKNLTLLRSKIHVRDITIQNNTLWISTFVNGLLELNLDGESNTHQMSSDFKSIISNNPMKLFLTRDKNLIIGTFHGLSVFNPSEQSFNIKSKQSLELKCLGSEEVFSILKIDDNNLIFSSQDRLSLYNLLTKQCSNLAYLFDKSPTKKGYLIYDALVSDNYIWLATPFEIIQIYKNSFTKKKYISLPKGHRPYSLEQLDINQILIGSTKGLFRFNSLTEQLIKLESDIYSEAFISDIEPLHDKQFLLSSDQGLLTLNPNFQISLTHPELTDNIANTKIKNGKIYSASKSNTLLILSNNGTDLKKIELSHKSNPVYALNLLAENKNTLWVSSHKGLFRVNTINHSIKQYIEKDGLQSNFFSLKAAVSLNDGKLYFGGRNGFNAFYPEDIKDNLVPPKVALTKLTRFNKEVVPDEDYEGFGIDKPIEYLEELEIGHRDYVIGFEFAGLHYADPMRNQYQYMLEGFHEDWVATDAKNRTATFTNLSPGDYVFRVKAANKDGVWSLDEDNVALKITVHPAPWLSWWAFLIYGFVALSSLLWFIRYRTQAAIARSKELEQEVSVRTKEIETQKNVIESLLERKNELFANISHEFRTPLTLILGPLEKELKALDSPKNPKHLQMIQRNATRLLGMVEQILKLTELKKEDTVNKVPHAVNPALEAIVESFSGLAESKQMKLTLNLDRDVNVMAAHDALEVMVGNLVSNAIKYTPEGGKVSVTSKLLDNTIQIQVTDTGVGMTKAQKEDVFERFVRLDKTSDIAGTGIGLSIVKELILAHNGQVSVDSIEGQGSTFTITLPTTEQAALSDTLSIKAIEHLTQGETTASEVTQATEEALTDTQQELILIIDDNPDMRDYISEVLNPNYHCITADRGETGIELAKTQVPDLIICDIMMPGIDGYEVAKHLRDDIITSHIPLVLLTAKGDKESRIQGWNENIDDYMTKPFDEEELRARVSNIIDIRNILSRKAGQSLETAKQPSDSEEPASEPQPKVLNKKEQAFVDKLMKIIEENYQHSELRRQDIASLMAVSDRQLLRKVKALLGKSAIEVLKEYRLRKASQLLKEGEQISRIVELVGFNSASRFSATFKHFFQQTPKEYQASKKAR